MDRDKISEYADIAMAVAIAAASFCMVIFAVTLLVIALKANL